MQRWSAWGRRDWTSRRECENGRLAGSRQTGHAMPPGRACVHASKRRVARKYDAPCCPQRATHGGFAQKPSCVSWRGRMSRPRRAQPAGQPAFVPVQRAVSALRWLPPCLSSQSCMHDAQLTMALHTRPSNNLHAACARLHPCLPLTWSALGVQEASRMDTKLHLRLCRH